MPVWLQITAALSAAIISGVMGIALIPYLKKCRFCEPDPEAELSEKKESDVIAGNKLKPTMCGILLIFGCIAGFVLSYTLYLHTSGTDRTSLEFQTESRSLRLILLQGLLFGIIGWVSDYVRTVRRKTDTGETDFIIILAAFFTSYSFLKFLPEEPVLDFGFWKWEAGFLSVPVRAVLVTAFWLSMQRTERLADGICITVSSIQLLFLTVLCISAKQNLNAIYTLTAAGACIGCFYWNLHPAKCRLGQTGTYWLGMTMPMLCLNYHKINILLLYIAVWIVNLLPLLFGRRTLLGLLRKDGNTPLQRILILTGFALFCCILSVMPEHT